MAGIAIIFGLLLSALGAVGYLKPDVVGTTSADAPSITALIPAFFGIALILCGLITLANPNLRKHAMHIAAVVGLLGLIGALMRPVMNLIKGTELNFDSAPLRLQGGMALLCLIFLFLCIRSFIAARRARV